MVWIGTAGIYFTPTGKGKTAIISLILLLMIHILILLDSIKMNHIFINIIIKNIFLYY